MRWKSLSWLCRIWNSQCAISTCGLPRSLQNTVADSMALYPSEFNLPNRAALLISDMTASLPFVCCSLSVSAGLLPQWRARLRLVQRSRFVGARFRPRLHLPVRQRPALRVRIVRGVPVGEPRPEPGGTPHPHRVAEPGERDLLLLQHQLHFPGVLHADVQLDEVVQRARAAPPRQEALVVAERQRAEHDAEAALRVPGTLADHRVLAQPSEAVPESEPRMLLRRDLQPVADELLDPDRHAEIARERHFEAFGAAHLAAEHPCVRQLGEVGRAAASAQRSEE